MNKLLLIKHSLPDIKPDLPAVQWHLSDDGRQRCVDLARKIARDAPQVVVCSREPKASQTGELLAGQLNIPWQVATDLHEHERPQTGFLSRPEFESSVETFFARPDELCFGAETASHALSRFSGAIETVLMDYPNQNVAIVAHGTVISLFVAQKTGIAAFLLWKRLGLPSVVTLLLPGFSMERIIEDV